MRRWPFVVFGCSVLVLVTLSIAFGSTRHIGGGWVLMWLSVFGVGALIMARVPGNSVGTLMFTYGVAAMTTGWLIALAEETSPDAVPWYEPVATAGNSAALSLIGFMLLRFPDGRLLSPRWRLVDLMLVLAATASAVGAYINNGWGGDINQARLPGPLREEYGEVGDLAASIGSLGTLGTVLALISLGARYRRAPGPVRTQLRSLILAVVVAMVLLLFFGGRFSNDFNANSWDVWVAAGILALIPLSIGFAIVRHGLYDIDRIISRTVVYASIVIVIAGVYVAIVFGLGSLLGDRSDSPVLPIVATAIVALIFQPVRERLERSANRVVFGRRATPYEVLSDFTHRVAATDDAFLADVARSIVDGTVATAASVWTLEGGELRAVSIWPEASLRVGPAIELVDEPAIVVPGATLTLPIHHGDRPVGAMGVTLETGEALPPTDESLLRELANGLGLALWNRARTSELRANVVDLQASRRRLVAIQDDTRHQLERDLHDGAQQRLVAAKVRLSIAKQIAERDGHGRSAAMLVEVLDSTDEAIEQLRDFARGVYPPLLQAEGLAAAISAHLERSSLDVRADIDIDERYSRELESSVYFTVVEALRAIEADGHATAVDLSVRTVDEEVALEVVATHDGALSLNPPAHLQDRFEAFGGFIDYRLGSLQSTLECRLPRVHVLIPSSTRDRETADAVALV